jgi:tetratricopeptide (TPR) repeat protein
MLQRLGLLACLALLCILPVQAQRRLPDLMDNAITFFMDRDYTAALGELNLAIQRYPNAGVAYNWRGFIHFLLQSWEAAYSDQSQAIAYNFTFAYLDRALVSAAQGDMPAALRDYQDGILAQRAYDFPADLTEKQPDFAFIALAYTRALEVDPDNYIALVLRGNAYANLDLFEEALADYQQAKTLAPDFALLDYSLNELQTRQVNASCALQNGATAQRLPLETAMAQTLDAANPLDFWCFSVAAAPSVVTLTMNATRGDLDPLLILYALGTENRPLARQDNVSPTNTNALLTYRLRFTGTYVVAAGRAGLARGVTSGDYTLTLSLDHLGSLSWWRGHFDGFLRGGA